MSTQIQRRKGTTAEHSTFTGAESELTVDTTKDTVVVHDGATAGGRPLLREDQVNLPTSVTNGISVPSTNNVAISTNGTGRLFVDANGNVGVGAASPANNLHVNASNATFDLQDSAATNSIGRFINASGILYIQSQNNTSHGQIVFRTSDGSAIERMRLDASGRLGLGTSSPAGRLHVDAAGTGVVIDGSSFSELSPPTSADNAYIFRSTNDGTLNFSSRPASGGRAYRFWRGSNVSMIIDDSGRLGIGTTSPSFAFHCNANFASTNTVERVGAFYRVSSGTASAGIGSEISLGAEMANSSLNTSCTIRGILPAAGNEGEMALTTGDSSGTQQERLRIDSSGRLLVGTSSSLSSSSLLQVYQASGPVAALVQSGSLANNAGCVVSAGTSTRFGQIGAYKHSGITNPCSYITWTCEDGANNYSWVDNSDILRISTDPAHIGTTSGTVVGAQTSDNRVKNILGPVEYGLNTLKQIEPVRYTLKTEPDAEKLGFIAQQVQPLVPQSVFDTGEHIEGEPEDAPTKLGMEYVALIPVLVNAIKELSVEVDALKAQLQAS